jgi:hypothetical protein
MIYPLSTASIQAGTQSKREKPKPAHLIKKDFSDSSFKGISPTIKLRINFAKLEAFAILEASIFSTLEDCIKSLYFRKDSSKHSSFKSSFFSGSKNSLQSNSNSDILKKDNNTKDNTDISIIEISPSLKSLLESSADFLILAKYSSF